MGLSLFIDAFIEDLGLSRSVVSWLYTIATVLGSLSVPLGGRLVDRVGPRCLAVVVIALFAGSCMGMGRVTGWVSVFVGLECLRGFGQGALGLINNHSGTLRFEHPGGLAIGILGLGREVGRGCGTSWGMRWVGTASGACGTLRKEPGPLPPVTPPESQ